MIDPVMDQLHTKHIQLDMEYDCEEQSKLLQLFLGCGPFPLTSWERDFFLPLAKNNE